MAVRRHEPGGIGRSAHKWVRTNTDHHGRQYRTHRIDHGKWSSHHQDFPATRREFGHRQCAGDGYIPNRPSAIAAGHLTSFNHQLQRFERADFAVGTFWKWSVGAAVERPRTKFPKASTGDRARGRDSVLVRR